MVGIRGLEPRTSSLSAKRSNRLSYIPEWATDKRIPELPDGTKSHRSVVGEAHEEPAGDLHRQVVEEGEHGAEGCEHDDVQDSHDECKAHHLPQTENGAQVSAARTGDVLHQAVDLVEDPRTVEHDPDEEGPDDGDDRQADPGEERELHGRPEIDVNEFEPDLLGGCGSSGRLFREFLGDATAHLRFLPSRRHQRPPQ